MPDFDVEKFRLIAGNFVVWFPVFLFSLTFHEAAHAWTSERFGDPTGRYLGRVSLNPMVHLDLVGTIIFPILGFFSGAGFFGWAKPVPVNPLLWREKTKANIAVSAAGPIANFILCILAIIVMKTLVALGSMEFSGYTSVQPSAAADGILFEFLARFLNIGLIINLALGVFNLLPIPPLDGSHILSSLLSLVSFSASEAYEQIRPYGFMILFAFLFLWSDAFYLIFDPFQSLVGWILRI